MLTNQGIQKNFTRNVTGFTGNVTDLRTTLKPLQDINLNAIFRGYFSGSQ